MYYVLRQFPSHQTLCLTRVLSLFIVYVDNSRVLSTSSLESGVEVMHSRSRLWSTEPTCRCIYISCIFLSHDRLYIQYEMYIEILFSTHYVLTLYHLLPQLYLILYIIYLFCSCIYILIIIFYPCDCEIVVVSFCEIVQCSLVYFNSVSFSFNCFQPHGSFLVVLLDQSYYYALIQGIIRGGSSQQSYRISDHHNVVLNLFSNSFFFACALT